MKIRFPKLICGCATVGLAILSGCDKKLDIKPVDTVEAAEALRTSADVEALLVGAYDARGDEDLYGGIILRDAELLADNGEVSWNGTYEQPREIFIKQIRSNNAQVEDTWNDGYEVINIANNVLNNLSVVSAANRNRVEGEAKFIRGLVYFDLVRFYARPWNDQNGTPASNPGVPLVLTPTTVINEASRVARNSVAEVYAQVLADLTDAARLLPASNGFFANQGAAQAILSRVYLTQERFADAATAANEVIASGEFELVDNYADAFNNSSNTSEDVFAIQVTSQDGTNNMN
ncbi:MAG TPA: RagB/SusD family nutrient uptake outer membrane protein, partial [Cytophagales bacterium]